MPAFFVTPRLFLFFSKQFYSTYYNVDFEYKEQLPSPLPQVLRYEYVWKLIKYSSLLAK